MLFFLFKITGFWTSKVTQRPSNLRRLFGDCLVLQDKWKRITSQNSSAIIAVFIMTKAPAEVIEIPATRYKIKTTKSKFYLVLKITFIEL